MIEDTDAWHIEGEACAEAPTIRIDRPKGGAGPSAIDVTVVRDGEMVGSASAQDIAYEVKEHHGGCDETHDADLTVAVQE